MLWWFGGPVTRRVLIQLWGFGLFCLFGRWLAMEDARMAELLVRGLAAIMP